MKRRNTSYKILSYPWGHRLGSTFWKRQVDQWLLVLQPGKRHQKQPKPRLILSFWIDIWYIFPFHRRTVDPMARQKRYLSSELRKPMLLFVLVSMKLLNQKSDYELHITIHHHYYLTLVWFPKQSIESSQLCPS